VLAAGWYFVFRSFARERQIARLQSDFVAAVSHEFRSPLTALTHAADLLVNDRVSSEGARQQTYQVLARDTARLRSLVEGLLTFGRLEAGAAFRFEETNVVVLVQDVIADVQSEVAARGYVIDLQCQARHVLANVDREAVSRAIRNLLDNAVKYSPDSRHIEVTVTHETERVAIAVRDHGLGIPAGEQRAIFDRFVRGAESTSRRIQGTGIGLAMVREIVRAHGGQVQVRSQPGEGSVFTMTIPEVSR
jgi:signal transduction histidine kinase